MDLQAKQLPDWARDKTEERDRNSEIVPGEDRLPAQLNIEPCKGFVNDRACDTQEATPLQWREVPDVSIGGRTFEGLYEHPGGGFFRYQLTQYDQQYLTAGNIIIVLLTLPCFLGAGVLMGLLAFAPVFGAIIKGGMVFGGYSQAAMKAATLSWYYGAAASSGLFVGGLRLGEIYNTLSGQGIERELKALDTQQALTNPDNAVQKKARKRMVEQAASWSAGGWTLCMLPDSEPSYLLYEDNDIQNGTLLEDEEVEEALKDRDAVELYRDVFG